MHTGFGKDGADLFCMQTPTAQCERGTVNRYVVNQHLKFNLFFTGIALQQNGDLQHQLLAIADFGGTLERLNTEILDLSHICADLQSHDWYSDPATFKLRVVESIG